MAEDCESLGVDNMLKNHKYVPDIAETFEFKRPPEAPLFTPTLEEFQNPFEYIAKIREVASNHGICKIKPPKGWEPPFCVDVEHFKFTPRVQQLNELEAKTRIRLNFIEQIGKFWALQGTPCTIPMVDKHAVDYFMLYEEVQAAGGLSNIKLRQWTDIARNLGFAQKKSIAIILKNYYEKYLHPFDLFKKGQTVDGHNGKCENASAPSSPSSKTSSPPCSPGKDPVVEETELSNNNKELKRLQFYGAGPKMAGYRTRKEDKKNKTRGKKTKYEFDPLAKYICRKCSRGDAEEKMLLCDGCDESYHTFCLVPPLTDVPEGDWRCPRCVQKEVCKPSEAFGFEQAKREYSLYQFGKMADEFKCRYFNMPVHMVPSELVEQEYWRIVGTIDEDVTVEYGADLHTLDHGSGFPTHKSHNLSSPDMPYVTSGWNLNNLPVLNDCILSHINADISGMKVPWMYVGMCFSTFCWHNEDHWSYSINYLHWGEAKTWYGVPGKHAPEFEEAMRSKAPELFESQPDLLHQLVTIMNPNLLMERGVPVFRTDQQAGEFVITFPRAYHAGFNQGYNFAEAVNFAPPDWLEMGRSCVDHYSEQHRYCVFSHDELVCKMAVQVNSLSIPMAASVCKDMNDMVRTEVNLRKEVETWGIVESKRVNFELQPDDERQCEMCQTTVFLSAVACDCKEGKLSCLRHYKNHCDCEPSKRILLYRYMDTELTVNAMEVKKTLDDYVLWYNNVREVIYLERKERPELSDLIELDMEGEKRKYPHNATYLALKEAIKEGETTISLCDQLIARRDAQGLGDFPTEDKMKENELKQLTSKASYLCCKVSHKSILADTLVEVNQFHGIANKVLQSADEPDTKELQSLIRKGKSMVVWLDEMPQLEQKLRQAQWLDRVHSLDSCSPPSTEKEVVSLLEEESQLLPVAAVEGAVAWLRNLLDRVTRWNQRAKQSLMSRPSVKRLEKLVIEAESIPVLLPDLAAVKDLVKKGRDWTNKYKIVKGMDSHPYLEQMDLLVTIGRNLQLQLDPLEALAEETLRGSNWIDKAARIFLRKNTHQKLLDALNPRKEVGIQAHKSKRRKQEAISERVLDEIALDNETIFANFQAAKQRELRLMEQLRAKNMYKRLNDTGDARYCLCNKPFNGIMLDCELCKEFYHSKCLTSGKLAGGKGKSILSQQQGEQQAKYLCPCCVRTRRPRIETVLPLLVDLTSLTARLHEGETLQCLTENAIHWQERAKAALATEEVASALAKLSVMNQRVLEAEARRKTERIISSELKKAASNPELQGHLHAISPMSGISSEDSTELNQESKVFVKEETDENMQDPGTESSLLCDDEDLKEPFSCSEHAYSSASKPGGYNSAARKNVRKTPLIPRHPPTKLQLTESVRCMLESLMMEGDLLEVSLDETQHIWRILHASCQTHKPLCYENLDTNMQAATKLQTAKPKVRRKKEVGDNKNKLKVVLGKEKQKKQSIVKKPKPKRKLEGDCEGGEAKPAKRYARKVKPKVENLEGGENGEEEDDDDGEDEACAAQSCLKPTGEEVLWVQCDVCTEWYHLQCEGLRKSDVNSTDDYICKKCQKMDSTLQPVPQEAWDENVPKVDWSTPLGV